MNTNAIESKWRDKWKDKAVFEVDPSKRKKKYLTAAFPYPNSPQHIGHARTYTTADIYARYLRMKGYNVLFPMAFHVTGTPILAMAKRLAKKDPEVLKVFEEIYGITPKTTESLTDPVALVTHFSKEIEEGMKEMGFSIDWRRKFYSFDERFNNFIQWQFKKLKQANYLIKGEYPIAWCPSDGNAVSAHDTKGDVDPELEEVIVIKFPVVGKDYSFVVTTYRPETIYGVTNVWINPEVKYILAKYKGENVVLAEKAAEILKLQMGLEFVGKISTKELLESEAKNPFTDKDVPVFSASFVSEEVGTGLVMSVPAHAPYDYLALRDLNKADIDMPAVLKTKEFSGIPAKQVVEKLKVKGQDDDKAEEATDILYKKEAHEGVMITGKYKGMKAIDAKEKIAQDLKKAKNAFNIVTITNGPVFCRCGSHIIVNLLRDQWFLDYGIPEWKKKAKDCLKHMRTIPEKTRDEFLYTIDWLKTRPCTRAAGLGTKFPFNESKMIEALSDSTIYMAYYTIAHLLNEFEPGELDEAFFDYVFLGKGKPITKTKKLRESFLYWYPVDSRHSAWDLVRNHLTLYIFNHTAIFEKKLWPKQIVTNGFVLMDGAKMSKSMGNILPLRQAIQEYGADIIRFSVVSGADLTHDSDFNRTVAEGTKSRLGFISSLIEKTLKQKKSNKQSRIDKWLLSRLNRKIQNANELYDKCMMRHLGLEIFYDVVQDLKWYEKRSEEPNLWAFFEKWIPLITPFMPHYAEEYWELLGKKPFVSFEKFPKPDKKAINESMEKGEDLIRTVHADIEKISQLVGKTPKKVVVFVAPDWKARVYELVRELKAFDKVMQAASQDKKLKTYMKQLPTVVKQLMKNAHSLPEVISEKEEFSALEDAIPFLKKEFNCEISVELAAKPKTEHPKRNNAMPRKPAIILD